MILKRGKPATVWHSFRNFLFPDRGYSRAWTYLRRRLERLDDTPSRIALGFSAGAFASCSPFFGLHFVIAAIIALMLRGNIIASLFGTIVGNPITFPLIAAISLGTGSFILHGDVSALSVATMQDLLGQVFGGCMSLLGFGSAADASWASIGAALGEFMKRFFLAYLIGGVVIGTICAFGIFYPLRSAIRAFKQRRREKLAAVREGLKAKLSKLPKVPTSSSRSLQGVPS